MDPIGWGACEFVGERDKSKLLVVFTLRSPSGPMAVRTRERACVCVLIIRWLVTGEEVGG